MQVIAPLHATRPPLGAVFIGVAVGAILLLGGLFLAWLAFATPVLTGLTQTSIRPTPVQLAIGAAVWGFALVAPASFAIVGAIRLGHVARTLFARPSVRALTRAASSLGDEYLAASNVRLPDGRIVRDLVLGPFGIAVLNELPPARVTRRTGVSWELRRADGRWVHYENPLERTTRDAERIRGWIGSIERDFVVKVYSAVVTPDTTLARTPGCAVVTAEQVPAWLASLPAARALTPDRRADVADQIRRIVHGG